MAAPVSIGLDVGSAFIRAVEVTRSKDRPTIDKFGQVALPEGAMVGGVVKDQHAVAGALRELWAEQKFRSKSVRLGITHQQVVVREVEIADLPEKDMRQALPHQVRDAIPLPVEQAILDFYPLGKGEKHNMVRGLLVAAPKEAIIDTVGAVEKAGLHVEKVDLACFAVLRAVAAPADGAEAIIDIGANGTLFVVHRAGVPEIVRTIPRGGDEITQLLSSRLNLSIGDAEKLKYRVGTLSDGTAETSETAGAVNEALRPLLSEIRSSINYYVNGGADRRVERVTLVGGGAQLPGLRAELADATDLPVVVGDPLQYVGAARHRGERDELFQLRASSAVSVGLILGAA
jgi:type IV pilus assembly protein PilM